MGDSAAQRPTPPEVLNAIAGVFNGDDWEKLSVRYRLARSVVASLQEVGWVIVPAANAEGSET